MGRKWLVGESSRGFELEGSGESSVWMRLIARRRSQPSDRIESNRRENLEFGVGEDKD